MTREPVDEKKQERLSTNDEDRKGIVVFLQRRASFQFHPSNSSQLISPGLINRLVGKVTLPCTQRPRE